MIHFLSFFDVFDLMLEKGRVSFHWEIIFEMQCEVCISVQGRVCGKSILDGEVAYGKFLWRKEAGRMVMGMQNEGMRR